MKTLAAFVSVACIAAAALLHPSEAEIVDCSSIYFTVPDCLDFVRYGSSLQKPRDACCTGLASILMASAECLCVGFGSIARFGVDFNFTKALSIPSVCNLPAPPSNCGTHLHSGELVDVKVQRPSMSHKLTLDALLFNMVGGQLKRFANARKDLLVAVNEMVRHMFDEIDYILEGQNAERFASLYGLYLLFPPPPPKAAPAPAPKATPPGPAPKCIAPAHAPQTASAPAPGPASSPASAPQVGGPSPSIYPGSPALPPEKSGSSTITTVSLATAVFGLFVASFVRN